MPIEFTSVELNHWGIRWIKVGATLRTLELVETGLQPLDELTEAVADITDETGAEPAPGEGETGAAGTAGDSEPGGDEEGEAPPPVAATARPDDDGLAPWSEIERRQIATLRRLVAEGHIPHEFVITALPGTAVSARLATFPFDKRAKIEQVLKTEVDSRLPFDIDDVVTDFVVLGKLPAPGGEVDEDAGTSVLAFAAFKGAVGRLLRLFRAAGIELRQISTQPVALAGLAGTASVPGPHLRVYLGEKETSAVIMDGGGRPLYVRTVPLGLESSILRWEVPESEKSRYREFLERGTAIPDGPARPDHSLYAGRIRKDIAAVVRAFEAQFSVDLSTVTWFGPGSTDTELVRLVSDGLSLSTAEFQPDAAALGELDFPPDRPPSLWGPATAMVLRLARPEKAATGVNLRREEFSYRSRFRDLGEKLLPATYFVVVGAILFAIGTMVSIWSLQEKLGESRVRVAEAYRRTTGKDISNYSEATRELQNQLAARERLLEVMSEISGVSILNHLSEISRTIKKEVTVDTDSLSVERDRVLLDARTADYNTLGLIESYFEKHPVYRKVEVRNTRRLPDGKVGFRMELYVSSEEEQAKALDEQKKKEAAAAGAAGTPATDASAPGDEAETIPDEPAATEPEGAPAETPGAAAPGSDGPQLEIVPVPATPDEPAVSPPAAEAAPAPPETPRTRPTRPRRERQ